VTFYCFTNVRIPDRAVSTDRALFPYIQAQPFTVREGRLGHARDNLFDLLGREPKWL
jgi:hypothetical protein